MAVAVDAASLQTAGTSSPITWSHTCTGSNLVLLVGVAFDNVAAGGTRSVTYTKGGSATALTSLGTWPSGGSGKTAGFIEVFKMVAPDTGAHTVTLSWSGISPSDAQPGAISFTGADQTTGTSSTTTADSAGSTVTSGNVTVSATTSGNMVAAFVTDGSDSVAFTAGTSRYNFGTVGSGAAGDQAAATSPSTGSAVTISWTQADDWYGAIALEVLAVSGGTNAPAGVAAAAAGVTRPAAAVAVSARVAAAAATAANAAVNTSTAHSAPAGVATANAAAARPAVSAAVPAGVATAATAANGIAFSRYIAGLAGGATGYFTDQHDDPILYLQDVPWGLPGNAGRWSSDDWQSEIDAYLGARASQGFTCIRVHIFGTTKTGAPDDTGDTYDGVNPFSTTNDPSSGLNETYWTRIDYLISQAYAAGITVEMTAAFRWDFDSGYFANGWTNTQCNDFGTALGGRYKDSPNVLWFFGDDYGGEYDTQFTQILSGIQGAGDTHLVTIEYYATGTTSRRDLSGSPTDSAFTWGGANADYNLVYYYYPTYFGVEFAYQETSPIPVIWGDGYYYGDSGGGSGDDRVERNMAWWALASGARGISTGSDGIWQWPSGAPAAVTSENWFQNVAGVIRSFTEALTGWQNLIPDTSSALVTAGRGTRQAYSDQFWLAGSGTDDYVAASLAPDGSLAVIYCAAAMSITIDESQMSAGYTATWVDPVTCDTTPAATGTTYDSSPLGDNSAGDADWVLVLQGTPEVSAAAGAATVSAAANNVRFGIARAGVATVHAAARKPPGHGLTSFRLQDGIDGRPGAGPSAPVPFTGNFIAAYGFGVQQGGCWFEGYWFWCCNSGQSTAPVKAALWYLGGENGVTPARRTLVSAATATSGTLTAGAWNYVPLTAAVPLSPGVEYIASVGVNGDFPYAASQFNSGDPFPAGISNGPLNGFSGGTGSNTGAYSFSNGLFSTSGSDPSLVSDWAADGSGDGATNFFVDVQVRNVEPVGYTGTYRLWPNNDVDVQTDPDAPFNYVVGTEIRTPRATRVSKIWTFSKVGTTQLATSVDVWDASTKANVLTDGSPSWLKPDGTAAAAGDKWIYVDMADVALPAGCYFVTIYNSAGSPAADWSVKRLSYWGAGTEGLNSPGINNLQTGPLYAPATADAIDIFQYNDSPGSTPPNSTNVQTAGQSVFAVGPPNQVPYLYVGGTGSPFGDLFQNYWVDIEIADPSASAGVATVTATAPQPVPSVAVSAGVAAVAAAGVNAAVSVSGSTSAAAGVPAVSAVAAAPAPAVTVNARAAAVAAAAPSATVSTSSQGTANAGAAAVAAVAPAASVPQGEPAAAATTATAPAPTASIAAHAGVATAAATAANAAVSTSSATTANAGVATVLAAATAPTLQLAANAHAQAALVTAVAPALAPLFAVARSTATITDPRDGTASVYATATSTPGVS